MAYEEYENENVTNISGYWYIPGDCKTLEDVKDKINLDNISYNKIDDNCVLCIGINDNKGKFDDYLASLISELYYVQSVSELYKENQDTSSEQNLDNRLKKMDVIDKIHDNIIFLKRLYFKGIYHLNRLAEYNSSQSDSVKVQGILDLDYVNEFYRDYYRDRYLYGYRYFYRYRDYYRYREYIEWYIFMLDNNIGIDLLEEYDDELIDTVLRQIFGNCSRTNINRLINIWTAIFCCELEIDNSNISYEKVLSDHILIDNINVLDKALGKSQTLCCMCYLQYNSKKEYDDLIKSTIRIRRFAELLSRNKILKKEYFDKKAVRCYSQMWIDQLNTQYFSLSCAPDTEKREKYYIIAENLLNLCQNHSKYEPAVFNEEMRYYYNDGLSDYVRYSDVKSKFDKSSINKMFSCCERKLLTIVEEHRKNSKLNGKVVHICIKYSPCEICHRALFSYEKDGIEFEIIAPGDRRNRSKYSDIDKKIKSILKTN